MNLVACYGSDEFISVLSETGLEGVRNFVERVQKHIAENETLFKFEISISMGCAEFDKGNMASVNDVLGAAVADMYDAKARRHAEPRARGSRQRLDSLPSATPGSSPPTATPQSHS